MDPNPLNTIPRGRPPTFTARLVILEEPTIVEKMQRLALRHGHSLGAEVRSALREHLSEQEASA